MLSFPRSPVCPLSVIPAAVLLFLSTPGHADTPLNAFRQDCHELAERRQNNDAQTAKLIIRSWIKGLDSAAAFNGQCGLSSSPLNFTFEQAGDLGWCAAGLEKFLTENAAAFPDNATAEQILPLWWISIHPRAEKRDKEILRARLQALRELKDQSVPVRRFPAKRG